MRYLNWVAAAVTVALALTQHADAQELTGTLKKIKDRGVIVIGRSENAVPFSFTDASGGPTGFSIELCNHIVDGIRAQLGMDKLEVRYVTIVGTTLIPLLVNGTTDMSCSTTTHTLGRQRQVDFLPTMYITGNRLLVRKDSGIHEIEDLKGKRVAVNQGTTNEQIMHALDAKLGLNIKFLPTEDQPRGWAGVPNRPGRRLRHGRGGRIWPDRQVQPFRGIRGRRAAALVRSVFDRPSDATIPRFGWSAPKSWPT